jgi:hypothetical protein
MRTDMPFLNCTYQLWPDQRKARRNSLPQTRNPPAFDVDHASWVMGNTRLRVSVAIAGVRSLSAFCKESRYAQDLGTQHVFKRAARNVGSDRAWARLIRTPPDERDQAVIGEGIARLKRLAVLLDARLGSGPYVNGPQLCFADIMISHTLYRYFTLDFERTDTPYLARYYQRLRERPAYRDHVMISYESLRPA